MMSENQKKQLEDARKAAIENTDGICATGEKSPLKEFDDFSNQINNE